MLNLGNNRFGDQNKQNFSWPFVVSNGPNKNYPLNSDLVRKPCSRRNSDLQFTHVNKEQWMPSFSSKLVKPNLRDDLKSESLRSYSNNPTLNEISERQNVNDEPIHKQAVEPIICYHMSLLNEQLTESTVQSQTESPDNTELFRRRLQNPNIQSDDQLDHNIKTGLFDLCSELDKTSGPVLISNDENRRYLDDAFKHKENIEDYVEENKQEHQATHKQTDVAQGISYDAIDKKLIPGKEISNNENLTKLRLRLSKPTKSEGITDLSQSPVMLIENSRVCYACNSASDPTCWEPSRRTTVKYCRKEHDACVTKTYKNKRKYKIVPFLRSFRRGGIIK